MPVSTRVSAGMKPLLGGISTVNMGPIARSATLRNLARAATPEHSAQHAVGWQWSKTANRLGELHMRRPLLQTTGAKAWEQSLTLNLMFSGAT